MGILQDWQGTIEVLKTNLVKIVIICVVIFPIFWGFFSFIYKDRLDERDSKISFLQSKLDIKNQKIAEQEVTIKSFQSELDMAIQKTAELKAKISFYEVHQEITLTAEHSVEVIEREGDTFTVKLEELSASLNSANITINNDRSYTFEDAGQKHSFAVNNKTYNIFFMGVFNDTAKFIIKQPN